MPFTFGTYANVNMHFILVYFFHRNESEDIKAIVEKVTHLLDKTDLFIADHPVRVESRVLDMIQLLDIPFSNDVLLLGMWGMGGIGKTTIAKFVYNKVGRKWFGSGSRIIITTRDKQIIRGDRVNQVYIMEEMDESESLELFSWHAFMKVSPRENFAKISRNVVEYCGMWGTAAGSGSPWVLLV